MKHKVIQETVGEHKSQDNKTQAYYVVEKIKVLIEKKNRLYRKYLMDRLEANKTEK